MPNLNKNTLATIIITNFNKSDFVLEAITSCFSQKYKNIQLVFFDDKSTDNSLKKIINFKKKKII